MATPTATSWTLTSSSTAEGGGQSGISGTRGSGTGKTGIAVPVSGDGRGRFAFVSGEAQLAKLISVNLSDCDSDNPFQDLGTGRDAIFAVNDDRTRINLRQRINRLFTRLQLQDRARLRQPAVFTTNSEEQELDVEIEYINLEEDKPGDVTVKFRQAEQPVA